MMKCSKWLVSSVLVVGLLVVGHQSQTIPAASAGTATAKSSFTRPADVLAYASGDLVANSTTAGSVVPLTMVTRAGATPFSGSVRRARVSKTGTGVTGAAFRVHLYAGATAPTVANGDNGVFSTNSAAGYLGSFDVTTMIAFTDGAAGQGAPLTGQEVNYTLQGGDKIFVLLEARGAYTPVSGEVFTVYLEMAP